MIDVFNAMDNTARTFWIIACLASLVFVIQTILTFIGLGVDSDIETSGVDSLDDGSFSGLFSFRNLINFLLGYGWTGVIIYEKIASAFLLQIVSVFVGLLFVAAFVLMFTQMMRLAQDNTFKIEDAIGVSGYVYLRIPALRKGKGKIQFSVKGSVRELDAITDGEELPTGSEAKIIGVIGKETLLVEKII
ncbi:MAG TPA: serine protease [Bacteroidaceae bacterium]|nr:serine protease [Bacteroidaceae bacterium]